MRTGILTGPDTGPPAGRHDSRPDGPASFIKLPGGRIAVETMVTSGATIRTDHGRDAHRGMTGEAPFLAAGRQPQACALLCAAR